MKLIEFLVCVALAAFLTACLLPAIAKATERALICRQRSFYGPQSIQLEYLKEPE